MLRRLVQASRSSMSKSVLIFLLVLSACQKNSQEPLTFVFSHNINAEILACGCREFPLGGMSQMAGAIHQLKQNSQLIMIDTGDTLFSSPVIPKALKSSSHYTAQTMAKFLDQIGLRYFVPGDQDMAAGIEFLQQIAEQVSFTFLVSNFAPEVTLPHKSWDRLNIKGHQFYFIGLVDPTLFSKDSAKFFTDPSLALQQTYQKVLKAGYRPQKSHHHLILLSHSGLEKDFYWQEKLPQLDWIIGAHSKNSMSKPLKQGKTRLVQVKDQNHFLGTITFDFIAEKANYQRLSVKDELKNALQPNPFISLTESYKTGLQELQRQEQQQLVQVPNKLLRMPTSVSCQSCHQAQYDFWQGTAHSLAYATLIKAQADQNPQCIGCHTLGHQQPQGFLSTQQLLIPLPQTYWKEFNPIIKDLTSVRKLQPKKIRQYAMAWEALDQKHHVRFNYANVQCLHCHQIDAEHPLSTTKDFSSLEQKEKCLSCHNSNQAKQWYDKNNQLKPNLFARKLKQVACPSL